MRVSGAGATPCPGTHTGTRADAVELSLGVFPQGGGCEMGLPTLHPITQGQARLWHILADRKTRV